ncbi:glutamate receptor ionotropic, kainate glr-3-like [Bombus flavifrons]|uniref:glutamate receptor ionotropic, kainate glr-3-like n=1 Tax=Bombus flavifrons TaxID=103934 RepID=UPI003703D46D
MEKSIIWDRNQQDFVQLYNDSRFRDFRRQTISTRQDLHMKDINGKVLRASYYEEQDLVMFYENDTKVTGICGDIWNLLACHLNFTLIPVKYGEHHFGEHLENGSYSGVMGLLDRNETQVILRTGYYALRTNLFDYTVPVWNTKYRLYIKPKYEYDKWLLSMFTRETLCTHIFLILIFAVVGYIFQYGSRKIRKRNKQSKSRSGYFNFADHIFYTYSIMCCQGYLPRGFCDQSKILSTSKFVFAWLMLLVFSSSLIYRMTNRTMTSPFVDFDTLLKQSKYNVLIFEGSTIYEFVKNAIHLPMYESYKLSERIFFEKNLSFIYKEVCFDKKLIATLENENEAYLRSKDFCPIVPVGKNYFQTWIGFGVPKRFPYKRSIDTSIIKLHEVGLIDILKDRWMKYRRNNIKRSPFKKIDINQVYLIFEILFIGIVLSLIILSLENIIFFCRKELT